MNKTIKILINNKNFEQRVDIYLTNKINYLTRSYIKKLITQNSLIINGITNNSPSTKVKTGDEISLYIAKKKNDKLIPKKIDLDIVFEDKDILIINKPKGMVVHPGAGNKNNTLANALAFKYKKNLSDLNGELRPGIVHRIDKETSGIIVIAKNNLAHSHLGNQFSNHNIKRSYKCLVWGVIRPLAGRIETLITRHKKNRQLMTVSDFRGKKAITNYKTIKTFSIKDVPKISLIECKLETGRTHQIRVHLKYLGSPILGDKQYGVKNKKFKKVNRLFLKELENIKGQALHAQTLEFIHPTKKKWMKFDSNLPKDFKKMLNLLNKLAY